MADPWGTDPTNRFEVRRTSPDDPGGTGDHFAAPLGSSRSGRLRFVGGAHRILLRADPRVRGLYRARFGNRTPTVVARGGVVTVRYPRSLEEDWLDRGLERPAEIALNACIPWDIEVRGGSSRLQSDLRDLRLASFRLEGGAGRLELALPAPRGTVTVVVLGGASNVAISRPAGIPARLRVEGGATNLTFGRRHIGAAGGDLDLRDRGYERAADRYDVAVTGGANNLNVDQRRERSGP